MKSGDVLLFSSPLASTIDLESHAGLGGIDSYGLQTAKERLVQIDKIFKRSVSLHPPGVT